MSWWQAAFLGLVQGLTEFIPVSSDGHLSAAEMLLPGFSQVGVLFDVMTHLGTLAAVILFFRTFLQKEAKNLVAGDQAARRASWELVGAVALAMVPTGIVGLFLKGFVEQTKTDPVFVGAMEIVTGALLAVSFFARSGERGRESLRRTDALLIGAAQGLAVLPGLSRSASTIAVGLLLGLNGRWAATFSFLLVIPAILGAAGLELFSAWSERGAGFFAGPEFPRYLLGAVVAGAVGYATIGWMIRMTATRRVHLFAIYCVVFGLALIFLLKR
jgi:undecaprenyl-diphosphatase